MVENNVVGLIPAAGFATRISSLECSKEIYPIAHPGIEPKVVSSYLIESFSAAGITQAYIVLRSGKWDIPEYFKNGTKTGLDLAFVVTDATNGVPQTINKAYSFISRCNVAFGFPDIITYPQDPFTLLLQKQQTMSADLVLGLYKAMKPDKVDMVSFDQSGCINNIHIKPATTDLIYTWINAVWTPTFTSFLHEWLDDYNNIALKHGELHIGDIIREAINAGIKTTYVKFESGSYVDIGTPEELGKVNNWEWLKRFYSED